MFDRFLVLVGIGICFLFLGCSSLNNSSLPPEEHPFKNPPKYSLIYIIHGDADYLYHKDGKALQADEQVLKEAFSVATGATNGEVFIFHQKPERKFIFFFPKKDRDFYHFKNGKLIQQTKYSPIDEDFQKEADFYKSLASDSSERIFLAYFGHEIPLKNGESYHRSRKNIPFNIPIFLHGLKGFGTDLDLILLSTCNGGNPYLINELSVISNEVVASPQNLHLSHLSSFNFSLLRDNPDLQTSVLADSIASDSFRKLTSFVETEITIAAYSMAKVSDYSVPFDSLYQQTLSVLDERDFSSDNKDCLDLPGYREFAQTKGVTSYYKSSSFGRNSSKKEHSGWGCKK